MRRNASALAAAVALLLYLATLSRQWTGDSLEFAMAVESGQLREIIEPHQLLIHPLGWAFFRLWRLLGWQDGALLPLQVLNALGGAVAVGIMYRLAQRLTGSLRLAGVVAAGFAVSYGTWLLSTEAEFVTVPLAVALALLWWMLVASEDRLRRPGFALALGVGVGVAMLVYQTSVFLVAVGAAGWLLAPGLSRRERLWQSVRFAGVAVAVWGAVYLAVLYALFDVRGWQVLRTWQLRAGMGTTYGVLSWRNVPHGGYALLRTVAGFPGIGLNDRTSVFLAAATSAERMLFIAYYAFVALGMGLPLVLLWRRWRHRHPAWRGEWRRATGMLATWALLFAAFGFYWVPGDVSFWLPVIVPWWLLVAGCWMPPGAEFPPEDRFRPKGRALRRQPSATGGQLPPKLLVAGVLALAAVNGGGLVLPHRDLDQNHGYQVARTLAQRTVAGDVIIVGVESPLLAPIRYFALREVIPFTAVSPPEQQVAGVLEAYDRLLAAAWERGRQVYALDVSPDAYPLWVPFLNTEGKLPGRRPVEVTVAWEVDGTVIYQLDRW